MFPFLLSTLVVLVELIACMSELHSSYFPIIGDLRGGVAFPSPDSEHVLVLFNSFEIKKIILIKKNIFEV